MEQVKIPFFKRMKRAIFNVEEYSNFILEKPSIAIKYLLKILIIFTILISVVYTYKFYTNGIQEETLNILEQYGFEENYIKDVEEVYNQIDGTYILIMFFVTVNIVVYIAMAIAIIIDILIFAVLALIIGRICRMKLKFEQAFNVAVYAITLPTILLILYMIVNILFGITIKYFSIAYDTIAYIYIITALLMLRADLIKQKIEVAKIVKEQEKIKKEKEEEEKEKNREEQEKEENKTKKRKKKDDEESKDGGEPEANKA